ncbi:MAG: hypothetical protein JW795_01925, partial [Chitinivibrionales bacterium]|nr:hypothetical protein [Chitinivibrionales bacterium]
MAINRKIIFFCGILFLAIVWQWGSKLVPGTSQDTLLKSAPSLGDGDTMTEYEDFITTENYANQDVRFFVAYNSEVIAKKHSFCYALIAVPGLSGDGRQFVDPLIKRWANDNGVIIIAPSFVFDEQNWSTKTSYQFPAVWSGSV